MKVSVFCVLLLTAWLSVPAETVAVKDAFHETVTVRKNPQRTVICYPSLLEIWLDCGGALVGIHSAKTNEVVPEQVKNLPGIGSYFHPNAEKIFQLKPDLVILSGMTGRNRHLAKLLRDSGIDVLQLKYDNYSDYREIAKIFCSILGRTELPAALQRVEHEIGILKRKVRKKHLPPPTFLTFFFNGSEFRAETSEAHAASIAEQLGGKNVLNPAGQKITAQRVKFSLERLMLEDPDIIFIVPATTNRKAMDHALKRFETDPALKNLKAVKKKRLILLPAEYFQYKPNRKFPEAFRLMAEKLYPADFHEKNGKNETENGKVQ